MLWSTVVAPGHNLNRSRVNKPLLKAALLNPDHGFSTTQPLLLPDLSSVQACAFLAHNPSCLLTVKKAEAPLVSQAPIPVLAQPAPSSRSQRSAIPDVAQDVAMNVQVDVVQDMVPDVDRDIPQSLFGDTLMGATPEPLQGRSARVGNRRTSMTSIFLIRYRVVDPPHLDR
jgi:hypothetical protein